MPKGTVVKRQILDLNPGLSILEPVLPPRSWFPEGPLSSPHPHRQKLLSFQGEPGECSCPSRGDPIFSGMPVSGTESPPPQLGERPGFLCWLNTRALPSAPQGFAPQPAASPRSPALGVDVAYNLSLLLRPPLPPRVLRDFGWAAPGSRARRCVSLVSSVSPLVRQRPVACPS